jgi:hypothetical protein
LTVRRAAAALLLVLLGTFAAFEAYVWTHRTDAPPPDDADLASRWKPVPDEANARVRLLALTIPGKESEEAGNPLRTLRLAGEWDRAIARTYLAPHAALIAAVDPAVAAAVYQPAWLFPPGYGREAIERQSDESIRMLWLGELLKFAWIDLAYAGESAAALDGYLRAQRFFMREVTMPGARTDEALQSVTGFGAGSGALRTTLPLLRLDAAESRRREREIEELRIPADAWRSLWREEYSHWSGVLAAPELADDVRWRERLVPRDYSVHVNRTRSRLAEAARALIAAADRPCSHRTPAPDPPPAAVPGWLWEVAPSLATHITMDSFGPNGDGDFYAMLTASTWDKVDLCRCRAGSFASAGQALIALRTYQLDHGDLPATLDALVPEYLSRVPADGYDDAPLRYSRERKLLWSIGDDLEDDGGTKPSEDDPRGEILWEIRL